MTGTGIEAMAEIVAAHQGLSSTESTLHISCRCGTRLYASKLAAHVAEQLAANGYGKLEACARPHVMKAPVDGHCWPGEITSDRRPE